jgi:hypothetical protein
MDDIQATIFSRIEAVGGLHRAVGSGPRDLHLLSGRGSQGRRGYHRDGVASLQELYEYVEQEVTARVRSVGGSQHPVVKGELEGAVAARESRASMRRFKPAES